MASKASDSDYKCSLSIESIAKAKKELGENPDSRKVEIKELRKRVEKIPGLQPRVDLPFLLAFLRARKFEQERAFQLIKNYYEVKKDRSDFFDDLKPSRLKHIIEDNVLEVLKDRDSEGCRVVILRPGRWDPDRYNQIELPKLLFLVLSKLLEDEETQVHGVHFINNLADVTWKQGKHVGPSMAKFFMAILQDMIPLRLKRLDYVHEPTFFDMIFPIIKQFMKEKLVKRIHMNGENLEDIHASINPDYLPSDLGGKLEPFAYNKEFMSFLMSEESKFEEDNKFGFVSMKLENRKKESSKEDAGMAGLGGTFKKLDI